MFRKERHIPLMSRWRLLDAEGQEVAALSTGDMKGVSAWAAITKDGTVPRASLTLKNEAVAERMADMLVALLNGEDPAPMSHGKAMNYHRATPEDLVDAIATRGAFKEAVEGEVHVRNVRSLPDPNRIEITTQIPVKNDKATALVRIVPFVIDLKNGFELPEDILLKLMKTISPPVQGPGVTRRHGRHQILAP